jgi:putative N6-adenine-specific DNA methylase
MSGYLGQEVQDLGYVLSEQWSTGVAIEGSLNDCIRLNLAIRTGNQVLWQLAEEQIEDAQQLYGFALKIDWENFIDFAGYVCITSNVQNETIDNNLFANVKLKDAIVDRFREKKGIRPNSGPERNKTVIHLFWKEDKASIYLDTTGETLSRHNYRIHPGLAPMQENLAAATIMATRWDRKSNFVNPMCGSGTLAIEAAMMAQGRSPGLLRSNYGFMHYLGYDEDAYQEFRKECKSRIDKSFSAKIIASDNNEKAIQNAISNAQTAGVDHLIEFRVEDFNETKCPEGGGIVMFNPEYGERLGEYEELEVVYKSLGDYLKREAKGYFGYIFTASPNLAKKVGLKAERKLEFFNSKLECRLLEYELYEGSKRAPKVD